VSRQDVPIEYSGEEQAIVAVGLAKPRPGVFVDAIQHLLVLCTTTEVRRAQGQAQQLLWQRQLQHQRQQVLMALKVERGCGEAKQQQLAMARQPVCGQDVLAAHLTSLSLPACLPASFLP
jgi:hypothetical protein